MRDTGKNIRALRMQKNMTQDELAEKLFVTRQRVSNYETGRSRPDVEMMLSIAEALDTDANAVLYAAAEREYVLTLEPGTQAENIPFNAEIQWQDETIIEQRKEPPMMFIGGSLCPFYKAAFQIGM